MTRSLQVEILSFSQDLVERNACWYVGKEKWDLYHRASLRFWLCSTLNDAMSLMQVRRHGANWPLWGNRTWWHCLAIYSGPTSVCWLYSSFHPRSSLPNDWQPYPVTLREGTLWWPIRRPSSSNSFQWTWFSWRTLDASTIRQHNACLSRSPWHIWRRCRKTTFKCWPELHWWFLPSRVSRALQFPAFCLSLTPLQSSRSAYLWGSVCKASINSLNFYKRHWQCVETETNHQTWRNPQGQAHSRKFHCRIPCSDTSIFCNRIEVVFHKYHWILVSHLSQDMSIKRLMTILGIWGIQPPHATQMNSLRPMGGLYGQRSIIATPKFWLPWHHTMKTKRCMRELSTALCSTFVTSVKRSNPNFGVEAQKKVTQAGKKSQLRL